MFPLPIVFMIGAGASAEFGVPAGGGQMKTNIARALRFGQTADGTPVGDQLLRNLLANRFGAKWRLIGRAPNAARCF
jgi:hypothetical protein